MRFVTIIAALTLALTNDLAAQESTCARVYADSVRNISYSSKLNAEKNRVFSEHCEINGSIRESSNNIDLTVPIKKVKIGFSGSQSDAKHEMQEFCISYASEYSNQSSSTDLTSVVATDALKSFNDCISLENQGVLITHQVQEPGSFIVRVNFDPSKTILDVTGMTAKNVSCTTAALDGTQKKLTPLTDEFRAKRSFTVQCARNSLIANGTQQFERATFGLATSLGTYSIALPPEGLLGYDLASQNKMTQESLEKNVNDLEQKLSSATRKIQELRSIPHTVTTGQYAEVTCPQWGGNLKHHAEKVCSGGKVSELKFITGGRGGTCGYATYAFSCIYD